MNNVIAPYDGVITEVITEKGSLTDPGRPLYKLADTSKGIQAKMTIENYKAKWLSVGDAAYVTLKSSRGDSIMGKVTQITVNAKDKENSKDIIIDLEAKELKGGEHVDITIKKEVGPFNFIIPKESLHEDINGAFVYIAEKKDGPLGTEYYVAKKSIFISDSSDTQAALNEGLMITDYIISSSDRNIMPGTRVKVEKKEER